VKLVRVGRLPEEVLLKESGVRHREEQSIVGASKWQLSDGLYAEVLFWRAMMDCPDVSGELLIVFNCSFGMEINFHRK
jgi:hypothetical protein